MNLERAPLHSKFKKTSRVRGDYKNETGRAAANMKNARWNVMKRATGAAQPQSVRNGRGWAASATEMQGPRGQEYFTYGPIGPYTQKK